MISNIHKRGNQVVVAVCDQEILGKKFEEGPHQLDLTSDFYQGQERSEEETGDLIRNADSVNLVGQKAVALGIKEGVIDPEQVGRIQGIPFAQATR